MTEIGKGVGGTGTLFDESRPDLNTPNLYAVDTETSMFDAPVYGVKTRIKPFGGHKLVLGSIAGKGAVRVLSGVDLCVQLHRLLSEGADLVFHNCAFDIPTIIAWDRTLEGPFIEAVDRGAIHDTIILEPLIQIAHGRHTLADKNVLKRYTLERLAWERCGMKLNKGDVRLDFGRFKDDLSQIPQEHLEYAAADALATYRVYRSQILEAKVLVDQPNCRYPVYPDATERYGLLTEKIQVQGALGLEWMERFPLRVDLDAAKEYRDRLEKEAVALEEVLISFGWAKRGPKTKKFKLSHKTIRKILEDYAKEHLLIPERSDTGLVSLNEEYWTAELGRLAIPASDAATVEERLQVWLRYGRVHKLLATYLYPYSSSPVHYPRYNSIGARTTRTSCSCPNVQNIPKHHDSIRSLFVPSPGRVFIEADFVAAELVALAQVYHLMFGGSHLGTALNAGEDPHVSLARRIRPDYDSLPEAEQKIIRQSMKAANYGLGGGMGARKFGKRYKLPEEEAKQLRWAVLEADPELKAYLADSIDIKERLALAAGNLNMSGPQLITALRGWQNREEGTIRERTLAGRLRAFKYGQLSWEIPTPPGFNPGYDLYRSTTRAPAGLVRGRASYTEAHNTPFQAQIALAAKLAIWNLYKAWRITDKAYQWAPVAFVHDSLLIECPPEYAEACAETLKDCMESAMAEVCRDVKGTAEVKLLGRRWSGAV
jgi:DNA polymerase I-like protein with 3'-5' exonuclease and polymerase domains